MTEHRLDAAETHREWNNALSPRLVVDPGDIVICETLDASGGYYTPLSTTLDIGKRGPFLGHPLTGPIYINTAKPGDTLAVEILSVAVGDHGWTAVMPNDGLLRDCKPHLQLWDCSDRKFARMGTKVAVPLSPFPGVVGVAPAERGTRHTLPPHTGGGNLDIKQLVAGSTIYLPVMVEGALFSIGDLHGAQGDGEVCGTAIEIAGAVGVRFSITNESIEEPYLRSPQAGTIATGPYLATTAQGSDLHLAAQQAMQHLIDRIVAERGLTKEEAYALCSAAADLKISEIVNEKSIVSAFIPESVFVA